MSSAVKDPATGVEFPRHQHFWSGGILTSLGAGVRSKKLGFLDVKVYAVTMYVDAEAAAVAERQERQPGSEAVLDVLKNRAFTKALQFSDALEESLKPILRGDEALLEPFTAFFHDKKLQKGSEVMLLWHANGPLDVCLRNPGDSTPYSDARPGLTIPSPRLGHALWELYLSPKSPPSPTARKAWLATLPTLAARTPET